ncbi:MAG: hypothetical protein EPO42_01800 [Gallionellaceae bacterium]|nr:MAG: hypothetical protein EPO42_01800 [Gallionellaceae bacterium]
MPRYKIAIIGGGISGLAAAYHLKHARHEFKIFEAAHNVGGNVRTLPLDVGGTSRWVDLGVNDFNKNSYTNLMRVFTQLGVEYAPLEDTISYSNIGPTGELEKPLIGFTMDGRWGPKPPEGVVRGTNMFGDAIKKFISEPPPGSRYWTVGEFVKWAQFPQDFIRLSLYPRINAMYFAGNIKPSEMPARQVAHYYFLQEGYGTRTKAERQYWVGGATKWIDKLAAYLQKDLPQVIFKGVKAQFEITQDRRIIVYTTPAGAPPDTKPQQEIFDKLILAVQARTIENTYSRKEQIPGTVKQVGKAISYEEDEVVVHLSTANMPPDPNTWRTYNINIFPDQDKGQRYNINYWINRHQNDSKNPSYNCQSSEFREHTYTPQYFLSLNPLNPIPDICRLKSQPYGNCTMFKFYHCRLNMDATKAQDYLVPLMMKGIDNVYFTGGYTKGAGLHEECWISGTEVAKHALSPSHQDPHQYRMPTDSSDVDEHVSHIAPEYMLDLI